MYSYQRNQSLMARKPMIYERARNGSARSTKSTKSRDNSSNQSNNIDNPPQIKPMASNDFEPRNPHPPQRKVTNEKQGGQLSRPKVYLRPNPQTRASQRNRTLSRDTQNEEERGSMKPMLSQPRYFRHDDKLRLMTDSELENVVQERDDPVAMGLLSRRRMSRAEMLYFPDVQNQYKANSVRTSRSEPSWMEHSRSRRFMYERNMPGDRALNRFIGGNRLRKDAPTDKFISFYRSFESKNPEIRMVLSEYKFQDLFELIEELSKILHLNDRERYIHSAYGTIIRDINEFEDGGVYFFGPPYIYEFGDYHKFREQNTPDLIESDLGTVSDRTKQSPESNENDEQNEYDKIESIRNKCKEIKIISNLDGILRPIKFLIEAKRHKSLFQVLYDLSELFSPRYGRVEGLCTRKGRTILNVGELFNGDNDEEYVAICAPMFDDAPSHGRNRFPPAINDPYFTRVGGGRSARAYPYYDAYYDPSKMIDVEVMGKYHQFEPAAFEKRDPFHKQSDLPPQEKLNLEWIYGYNGKNCRNNLFILPSEEVVYFVAKVIVIYDNNNKEQRFYTEHTDEIRCMIQHPNSWIFASAQVSGGGEEFDMYEHVRIWDSKSLLTLKVLSFDEVDLSIECLAFSQADNGVKLATISTTGDEWSLCVWDWQEASVLSKSESYKEIDLACVFDPAESDRVVSCGKQHVYFWDVSGDIASYDIGVFEGYQVPEYVTCLGYNSKNELITGDSNAFIHFWQKNEPKTHNIIKTKHTGSIIIIQLLSGEHILTGGGSDRMLTLIDCNEIIPTVSEAVMSEEYGGIVAIAPFKPGFVGTDFSQMKLFLGTSMNTILYGTMGSEFECLVSATSDQLTSMAISPKDNFILLAGQDSFASLKSIDSHADIWRLKFDYSCTAATFYPTGDIIVIGTSSGLWIVIETLGSNQIESFETDQSKVTCVIFSPNGKMLAVGTEKGSLCLYNVYDDGAGYSFQTMCKPVRESIVSIDWASSGTHFRYVTSTYDIGYFNVYHNQEERRPHVIRDIIYDSHTTALHYSTAGIWKTPEKEVLFPTAAVSSNNKLLCAGTTMGDIRLYRYPASIDMPLYNETNINSSGISKVLFTLDDKKLITCGENDYCIAQWSFEKNKPKQNNTRRSLSYHSEAESSPRKEKVIKTMQNSESPENIDMPEDSPDENSEEEEEEDEIES